MEEKIIDIIEELTEYEELRENNKKRRKTK